MTNHELEFLLLFFFFFFPFSMLCVFLFLIALMCVSELKYNNTQKSRKIDDEHGGKLKEATFL